MSFNKAIRVLNAMSREATKQEQAHMINKADTNTKTIEDAILAIETLPVNSLTQKNSINWDILKKDISFNETQPKPERLLPVKPTIPKERRCPDFGEAYDSSP